MVLSCFYGAVGNMNLEMKYVICLGTMKQPNGVDSRVTPKTDLRLRSKSDSDMCGSSCEWGHAGTVPQRTQGLLAEQLT